MNKLFFALALMGISTSAFAASSVQNSIDIRASILPPITSSAVEQSHVFRASGPSVIVDWQVNNTSASSIWVMILDASAAPSAGTITGCTSASASRPCVAKWYQVGANSTVGVTFSTGPFIQLQAGQTFVCSSTGPYTITYTTSCVFSAEAM